MLVDYDGTIATTDVAEKILYEFIGEKYRAHDEAYAAGLVGSRTLFESQVKLLPGDRAEVVRLVEPQPHDQTFASFARRALEPKIPFEAALHLRAGAMGTGAVEPSRSQAARLLESATFVGGSRRRSRRAQAATVMALSGRSRNGGR